MGVSIFFLVVMVLVGGIVAYLGDSIGRNIGKKRLRVGRLRPKHTAAIGTFVAGMLGTTATILVLFALAEPVRSWILEGDRAREELKGLTARVSEFEKDLAGKEKELEDKDAQIALKDGQIAENNATLKSIEDRNEELLKEQSRLIAEADRQKKLVQLALKEAEVTKAEIASLQKERLDLQARVNDVQSGLTRFQKEFGLIQTKNEELQRANIDLEDKIAKNEEQIELNLETIANLNATIKQTEAALSAAEEDYTRKSDENRRALEQSKNELVAAQNRLVEANKDLEEAQRSLIYYSQQAQQTVGVQRLQPLIFNRNDEMARIRVPANTSRTKAVELLQNIVQDASTVASLNGAVRNAEGSFIVVLAVTNSKGLEVPLSAQFDTAVTDITARPEDYLLIARTPVNGFEGEPIGIYIEVKKNPIIYQAEDVVLELQMDGRDSEEQILDQIFDFLQSNLYDQAVKDGMIPAIGQEAPIGEVTRDQILEMASRVKAANRTIRLQLLAREDTRAGDKLRLTFRLRA